MGEYGKYRPLVKAKLVLWRLVLIICFVGAQANACGLALLLAIDVSRSVDDQEYALQTGGIADALRDPSVISAITSIHGGVALSVMQWSGRADQKVSIAWRGVVNSSEIRALAEDIEALPRAFASETAPGSALRVSEQLHLGVSCARHITDVSGDGIENSGITTRDARDAVLARGHTINGLVILGDDPRLEDFYRHNVIGGAGHFLEIARGFDDYGRAMRDKLLKELPQDLALDLRP